MNSNTDAIVLTLGADDACAIASGLLCLESQLLDQKAWREWLSLYAEKCAYWVPAWKDEFDTIEDPDTEVSLIYHANRYGLEERVARIQSRKSITAMPLPRTMHAISNVRAIEVEVGRIEGNACFTVHVYDPRTLRQHVNVGRYEYRLRLMDVHWRFESKKVTLINDNVPTILDFYTL